MKPIIKNFRLGTYRRIGEVSDFCLFNRFPIYMRVGNICQLLGVTFKVGK